MVRKLREKNWVQQKKNEKNNREYNLFLTEQGMMIFKNHAELDNQCYKRNFLGLEEFSNEELKIYLEIQKKINHFKGM